MKNSVKKLLFSIPLLSLVFTSTSYVSAAISIGSTNPCGYFKYGKGGCAHEDRYTGGVYVDNWIGTTIASPYNKATQLFKYRDNSAWELDMLPKALYGQNWNQIDDVDFFNFTGHGFAIGRHGVPHNSNHFYTLNSNTQMHPSGDAGESTNDANADSAEIWFGYNANGVTSNTKWVSTYSCNFLNTTDSSWASVMQGVHMVLGFGSVMFMVGDDGWYFGSGLVNDRGIKNTWFDSARNYQINSTDPVIARVLYADISVNDTITSYSSKPQPIGNSNVYWYESVTIQP